MSKTHVDHQEAFRKIWIIIILCVTTTTENLRTIQLLRPLMSQWQSNLIRVINNLVPESLEEALIMRILIAIITILPNLHSAFMLMEIIIITNANLKRQINDHLKIKERFQQSSAWHKLILPFQTETRWHLSSSTSKSANSNSSNLSHKFLMLFHTTLLNRMDNLNNINKTNIILIIRLIRE
jgi:hypothetical protein